MTIYGWEVRIYSKTNTTHWQLADILSDYKGFTFTKVVNDSGSGSLTLDYRSLNAAARTALARDCLVAFARPEKKLEGIWSSLGTDVAFGFLPENIEHSYAPSNEHDVTISGDGVGAGLNRSVVLPLNYPTIASPAQRVMTAVRPLDCWVDLMAESKARGAAGYWISPWVTFGGDLKVKDSKGILWPTQSAMNIDFELRSGTGMLDVLKWAQGFGEFDFSVQFSGYQDELQTWVFCFERYRQDLSQGTVFFLGRHHLAGKQTHTRESIMTHLYSTVTENGIGDRVTLFNGGTSTTYGMREFFWSQAEEYQHSHGLQVGTKILNGKQFEGLSLTFEVVPNLDHRAFVDYDIHDLVTYDNHLLSTRLETACKGISVKVDENQETHEVMLETPIETFVRRLYYAQNRQEQQFKFNSKLTQV